ncbi:MAG: class I SAM-dependent methyltransferase [Candidatus Woesearchaeota archaeon]
MERRDIYYEAIAKGYDELHRDEQLRKSAIIKKEIPIKEGYLLLDVGCGPCFHDFGCKVVGIDTCLSFLKGAKKNASLVIQGYAENLPFKDNSFDIVVSITALQNFSNPKKALIEIKRVGRLYCAVTYLAKSKKAQKLESLIKKTFPLFRRIVEEKDIIFIINLSDNRL